MTDSMSEQISLSTAQLGSDSAVIPIAGGSLDTNENVRTGLLSTRGETTYTSRVDIGDFVMSGDNSKGDQVFVVSLSPPNFPDPEVQSLSTRFIHYTLVAVGIAFKCIAPWSTASGSMQVSMNPDPENPISTSASEAIVQALRLMESKQLSSKGELAVVNFPINCGAQAVLNDRRFCKPAAVPNPRMESYGQLAGIVRGVPQLGDGTDWTATLTTTWKFHLPTLNSVSATGVSYYSGTISAYSVQMAINTGNIIVACTIPTNGKVTAGDFTPSSISEYTITLTENEGEETEISETYSYAQNTGEYADDGVSCIVYLRTNFASRQSNLSDPESATITTTLVNLQGVARYQTDTTFTELNFNPFPNDQPTSYLLAKLSNMRLLPKKQALSKFAKLFSHKKKTVRIQ